MSIAPSPSPVLMSPQRTETGIKRLIRPLSLHPSRPPFSFEFPRASSQVPPPIYSTVMPLVQRRPRGQLVRLPNISFRLEKLTKRQTRTFVEGYHFAPLWSRRKLVQFDADVPVNETSANIRFVNMKSEYNRTATSLSIHESRVHIGADMFLVSGYWDPKADINRSLFADLKVIWRGEISVIRAGVFVPYWKRMRDGEKAVLAVKRYAYSFMICYVRALMLFGSFAMVFKHRRASRRSVPKTILGLN